MIWEIQRYDWYSLRAARDCGKIPNAIIDLQKATTVGDAEKAYWKIDNTVVVQGALYEAAVPVIPCLLSILQSCTDFARPFILELLQQLGSGEAASSEIQAGNIHVAKHCLRELCFGTAIYFELLENGTDPEQRLCIDLLGLCCTYDDTLKDRVKWWFNKQLSRNLDPWFQKLIENWLDELE